MGRSQAAAREPGHGRQLRLPDGPSEAIGDLDEGRVAIDLLDHPRRDPRRERRRADRRDGARGRRASARPPSRTRPRCARIRGAGTRPGSRRSGFSSRGGWPPPARSRGRAARPGRSGCARRRRPGRQRISRRAACTICRRRAASPRLLFRPSGHALRARTRQVSASSSGSGAARLFSSMPRTARWPPCAVSVSTPSLVTPRETLQRASARPMPRTSPETHRRCLAGRAVC